MLSIFSFCEIITDNPMATKKVCTNNPVVNPKDIMKADFFPLIIL